MLKKLLLVLVIAVAGLLGYAATRPDTFSVERVVVIQAPPEKVFSYLADFHNWSAWSPWEKLDPAMKRTFSGPISGPGAVYAWDGNKDVGSGRMEITAATPATALDLRLDFLAPFESHNTATFMLRPEANATRVTWTMRGPMPFLSKVMSVFFSMDQMIGKDFEAGLVNLKTVSEH